ncbi:mannonate dehydratase [Sphingobacterium deserti]|uniref:Mannonate dehydratase n=1 Tax=Sphingobacterium deserti TaxID=1229276 RepID=A0A0B8T323_9SPHI|nr:mannonate dehydratase [Sphingobacterium deserti]KGE15426.1 D-mannonate dehydratase [Sphingobacterium deserti]
MAEKYLQQGWRWYGPNDPVSLQDVKQAGATAIVSALHHIPHGEIWPKADILERKHIIEEAGLVWSVVESVTIHEAIKTKSADVEHYLENYRQTLQNLADCGIKTVCYNFMPVLDWTRTQLDMLMNDGSKALYFDWIDLAIFDIYILERPDAAASYPANVKNLAEERFKTYSEADKNHLQHNVLMGIPGEKDPSVQELRDSIEIYSRIGFDGLRKNLAYFLNAIADVCERNGIKMTIHPDDPPYPILGLPRIASNIDDFQYIISCVDKPFNGVCFCTGSLGAGPANDLPAIFEQVAHRVYFAHLRNVKRDELGSFYEADHLDGDVDMYAIMKKLVEENQQRDLPIPFRPDHGHQMLDDLHKKTNPGYSAIGRLRGLAELRGLELGIIKSK